jgi:hypothetical protein
MLAGLGALAAGVLALRTLPQVAPSASEVIRENLVPAGRMITPESLGLVVARDPFRIQRAPSPVVYDPLRPATPLEQQAPPPPKPVLTLTGIVWGPVPAAVIEGFPSIEGSRVVQQGEKVGGLRVERVTSAQVVIVGQDTTWTLTVRGSK